jgi:hypothetical protein
VLTSLPMNPAREQPATHIPLSGAAVRFADRVLTPRRTHLNSRPPLRPGTDLADAIYRDQVRREVEAAHRWLAQQKKSA